MVPKLSSIEIGSFGQTLQEHHCSDLAKGFSIQRRTTLSETRKVPKRDHKEPLASKVRRDLTAAALKLAKSGLPVFPTNDKKPVWSNKELGVGRGEGGYKIATRNPNRIKELFSHPRATELGVPMGEMSELMCIDVDLYKHPDLQQWVDDNSSYLSRTMAHKTRSGGHHYFFKHPGNDVRFPSTMRQGVDIKAVGTGYVCFPPTEGYKRINRSMPKKFPMEFLSEALKAKGGTGRVTVGSAFNNATDEELIEAIQSAAELYPALRSLSFRMPLRRLDDGSSINEEQQVDILQNVMDSSVAAEPGHARHDDWADRRGKIPDLVNSAIEKHNKPIFDAETTKILAEAKPIFDLNNMKTKGTYAPGSINKHDAVRGERRRLITTDEMMSDLSPPDWLINDYLESDTLAVLYGAPKSGKTFVVLDIALSVASGVSFHGKPVQQGAVIYVTGEGLSGLKRRTKAWCIEHQTDTTSLPVFWSRSGQPLTDRDEVFALSEDITFFANKFDKPIRLIVIDTLNRNFGGADENNTKDMTAFVSNLDHLRSVHGATILVVHHTGLSSNNRARGSSVLYGAVDANMQISQRIGAIAFTVEVLKDADTPPPLLFSKHVIEFEVPGEGQASSLVLRTSEVPATTIVRTEFFSEYPTLHSRNRRDKFERRLPCILEAMYGGPKAWKTIANAYGGKGKGTFDGYMKRLREAGLVHTNRYELTDDGNEAARRLVSVIGLSAALVDAGEPSLIKTAITGQKTGLTGKNDGSQSG